MVSLLKTFGKGVLYVVGLPFFILALVIFAIIGIFAFLYQIIISIFFFFTGRTFFPELPEDKELRLKKESANQNNAFESSMSEQLQEEPSIVSHYEEAPVKEEQPVEEKPMFSTVEEACFEETKEEMPIEDTQEESDPFGSLLDPASEEDEPTLEEVKLERKEETLVETAEPKLDEDDLVEELETYVPRSSTYSANDDDDDDDTDIGVDIDYDFRG